MIAGIDLLILAGAGMFAQMSAADSPSTERVLRDARSAQSRFERIRRSNLPIRHGSGGGRVCDARIGRYCYWYDPSDSTVEPEPKRIIDARASLLGELNLAARLLGDDAWISGQLTRYLIEANRLPEAAAVARRCRGERWWCAALEGLALHVSELDAAADSMFTEALAAMPAERRCEWLDIRDIADARWSRELGRSSCESRVGIAERIWKLSQPLWMTPGNDLRNEHFARQTMSAILERTMNAQDISFGADTRELIVRYGWPEWFSREFSSVPSGGFHVIGHDRNGGFYFFPDIPSARAMLPTRNAWTLNASIVPSRYAPRRIRKLSTLQHQLARFARGDSSLLAVAYRLDDTLLARDTTVVALVASGRETHLYRAQHDGGILAIVPRDTQIVSLEALGSRSRHAARARYSVPPLPCRGEWCLSDLLLLDSTATDSIGDAETAVRFARTSARIPANSFLGVFWEVQRGRGTDERTTPATFSLTVTPLKVGLMRRLAAGVKLAPPVDPVRLRWQGVIGTAQAGQHVVLRLPPRLATGTYKVTLDIERPGSAPLNAEREIEVIRER